MRPVSVARARFPRCPFSLPIPKPITLMGLPSGRAAATSPSPPLSPTHPVSIRFAGGVRTRGDGELLLLHAVFTNGDRDSAALLRVATRRRQAARGADRDRAAMSTSRRRTLLKVIVLGDSGSAHCSLPAPPSPNPAPPSLPRIRFTWISRVAVVISREAFWRFDLDAVAATSVFHSVPLV